MMIAMSSPAVETDVGTFTSYAEWLRTRIKERGWSQHYVARSVGASDASISMVVSGKIQRSEEPVAYRLAVLFGDPPGAVHALAGYTVYEGHTTIGWVEEKRRAEGLSKRAIALRLGVGEPQYAQWCREHTGHLRLRICGLIVCRLGGPAEDILRWEGYWDRLSPRGRVVAPAMLRLGLDQKAWQSKPV